MAGIRELGAALHRQAEYSDEEEEDIIYLTDMENDRNGPRGALRSESHDYEDDRVEIAEGRHHRTWRARYGQSLEHFKPIRPLATSDNLSRIDRSGCLSFITFGWVFGYLWSAFKGLIPRDQTWTCSVYDSAGVNMTRLEYLWEEELKGKGGSGNQKPSLFRVTIMFFRTRLIVASIIFSFCLAFGFIGPTCLVRVLIAYVEKGENNLPVGLTYVAALLTVEICRVLSYGATWAINYRTGIRVRGAILGLLYKKLLRLRSLTTKTPAEIVNVYANDGQRLFDAVTFAPLVVTGPLVLVGGTIYLLFLVGPWCLLGLLVFLLFDVVQVILGKTMVRCRNTAILETEKRVSLMGEVLRCIRVIKMNATEHVFMDKVQEIRHAEKSSLKTAGFAQSLAITSGPIVPVVATIVTFLALVGSAGHNLLASEAFSAITVFFVMVFGIRMIPYGMRYCAEAVVALRRIQEYLMLPEAVVQHGTPTNKQLAIVLQDAYFAWPETPQGNKGGGGKEGENQQALRQEGGEMADAVLHGVNMVVEKKQLVGLCGPIGSGKSALLSALIGQMSPLDGNVLVGGRIAYASQQPWIQNLTVRENMLFGEAFDEQRYYRVLYASSLTNDINLMSAGDKTEIGERGVTLSGGQKARLALARALYSCGDVYLLDDVLSSLDRPVAEHVFNYALKGVLSGKTTVMVTNNVQHLSMCDEVVYMEAGRVVDQGPHSDLLQRCQRYAAFTDSGVDHKQPSTDAAADTTTSDPPSGDIDRLLSADGGGEAETSAHQLLSATAVETPMTPKMSVGEMQLQFFKREQQLRSETNLTGTDSILDIPAAVQQGESQITDLEEDLGLSSVSWHVYKIYADAGGGLCAMLVVLLVFVANVGSSVFATIWLAIWLKRGRHLALDRQYNTTVDPTVSTVAGQILVSTTTALPHSLVTDPERGWYMLIYGITILLLIITGAIKAIVFVKVTLRAASRLHNRMFQKIMSGSMRFFDSTPSGRILNRFSKDMDELDVKLSFTAESFLQNLLTVVAYLAVILVVFHIAFLVALVPVAIVFLLFVACFRAGIRSLKRHENVSRSPLFDHITSSLEGLPTIHAFGQTKRFVATLKQLLDNNSGAMLMFQSAMRWLAVWLDLLVVAITFATSLLMVLLGGGEEATLEPALAGMALAFAIQMSGIFQFSVRMQTELEAKMTSVERIGHYIDHVDDEGLWNRGEVTPGIDWPEKGRISFRDVTLKYRENLPFALKGVTFDIQPKERIGIVGRTGSGKSSLAVALFRLYPITSGSISIDGIDINTIELHELRRSIEAIPQDPVLFKGTVRFNLDPKGKYRDEQLWEALDTTRLKPVISEMEQGLDSELTEGGANLSAGERQLLCMTRALLRRVRIVLLDEATSSLDSATDQLVRRCLNDAFQHCTTIVIAHRLSSVIDAHRILYIDAGKVIEFDQPKVLLEDRKSRFYQMVNQQFIHK